ncbi:MAG: transposase [Myxococcales bacterium]|nr:transposase [Myxococcales bacterium]
MPMHYQIRWTPVVELSDVERRICSKLKRTGRLFKFLREHRHALMDEEFQSTMAEMYKDTPVGRPAVPPAMLMMVTLLQAYTGTSDAEAVQEALFNKRWQMVLDCLDCDRAPFSQGALAEFRFRVIQHDLDRELIRRSVALARETRGFGYKNLRVALDSAPIWGAGRVEDTFNLIGHALMMCVARAGDLWDLLPEDVIQAAGLRIVGGSSVKAAPDIDWDDENAKAMALNRLLADVDRLTAWIDQQPKGLAGKENEQATLSAAMDQLERLIEQDTEPDPDGDGGHRVMEGTAPDRQVSATDPEMRHGRKSKSKTIDGYKGHIAFGLDEQLVYDGLALPANHKEHAGADLMRSNIEYFGTVDELHIDRGYLSAQWVVSLDQAGGEVLSKPWNPANGTFYPKSAFAIDLQAQAVTCPAGEVARFPTKRGGGGRRQVLFQTCQDCHLKPACTKSDRGRSVVLHPQEDLLQRLQHKRRTPDGRKRLRERVAVEHALAHNLVYAPHQARYIGARKNTMAIRTGGTILNLQAVDRHLRKVA